MLWYIEDCSGNKPESYFLPTCSNLISKNTYSWLARVWAENLLSFQISFPSCSWSVLYVMLLNWIYTLMNLVCHLTSICSTYTYVCIFVFWLFKGPFLFSYNMNVKGQKEIWLGQSGFGTVVRIQDSRIHSRLGNCFSIKD